MNKENINKLILRGRKASGKSWNADLIQSTFDETEVLKLYCNVHTLIGINRAIHSGDYKLIIFEECIDNNHIISIYNFCLTEFIIDKPDVMLVFITTDLNNILLNDVKIIECNYQNN